MSNSFTPGLPARTPPWRGVALGVALLGAAACSLAQTSIVSRSGSFVDDDEVVSFAVHFDDAGPFTARTGSYAAGGFAPLLTLTDLAGEVLFSGAGSATDSVCSAFGVAVPAGSFCWDTGFSFALAAGDYVLYLSQDGNAPAGSNVLLEGFGRSGQHGYTAEDYLGLPGSSLRFVQPDTSVRGGQWALDYSTVVSQVPEPPMALAAALGVALLLARSTRRAASSR